MQIQKQIGDGAPNQSEGKLSVFYGDETTNTRPTYNI